MADYEIEIPDVLESVIIWCLRDAKKRMLEGQEIVPFSALAVGDTLFTEEHPADEVEECYALARKTVSRARGAKAYGFCYDGYVELDSGTVDALIAEGGVPGNDDAYAFGVVYHVGEDGAPAFDESPIYVGEAPNFMAGIREEEDAEAEEESEELPEE